MIPKSYANWLHMISNVLSLFLVEITHSNGQKIMSNPLSSGSSELANIQSGGSYTFIYDENSFWVQQSTDAEYALKSPLYNISFNDLCTYIDIEIPFDLSEWADGLIFPAAYWVSTFAYEHDRSAGILENVRKFIFMRKSQDEDFNNHPTVLEIKRVMEAGTNPYNFRFEDTNLSI